jgi:hypothetical protein
MKLKQSAACGSDRSQAAVPRKLLENSTKGKGKID